jgi:hypothetical protein
MEPPSGSFCLTRLTARKGAVLLLAVAVQGWFISSEVVPRLLSAAPHNALAWRAIIMANLGWPVGWGLMLLGDGEEGRVFRSSRRGAFILLGLGVILTAVFGGYLLTELNRMNHIP